MNAGGPNRNLSPWCELLLAYGWLQGDSDLSSFTKRLSPAARPRARSFADALRVAPEEVATRRCEKIVRAAGLCLGSLNRRRGKHGD